MKGLAASVALAAATAAHSATGQSMLADLRNQAFCGHYHTEGDEPHMLGAGAAAVLAHYECCF